MTVMRALKVMRGVAENLAACFRDNYYNDRGVEMALNFSAMLHVAEIRNCIRGICFGQMQFAPLCLQ